MNTDENNAYIAKEHAEALRYMANAEDTLKKAVRDDGYYMDKKYVRAACGIAYLGVLIAVDAWLAAKGVPDVKKNKRKSIEWYMSHITNLDKKMLSDMDDAYQYLHLSGYYDGTTRVKKIEDGFGAAYTIIDRIKPADGAAAGVDVGEGLAAKAKRKWHNLAFAVTGPFTGRRMRWRLRRVYI